MGPAARSAHAGGPAGTAGRAAGDVAAGLLRRLHPTRDRRHDRAAARHGQEPDTHRHAAAPRTPRRHQRDQPRRRTAIVTTPRSPHEEWEELAAGYVLDALEPDEEHALLTHLATCTECRRVVDEHAFVAAQLGSLSEDSDVTPPGWASIRSGIVADAAAPVSLDERRMRRRSPRLLGAAAAAVLLAGAAVAGWQLASNGSDNA